MVQKNKTLKKTNKKNVLYILGSGGHTQEMIILSKDLKDTINYFYLIQKDDVLSEKKIIYPGKIIKVKRPRMWGENIFVASFRSVNLFFKSFFILKKNKIDIIISTGPGISLIYFISGWILRKKLIFIECFSRVKTKTITGRFVYPLSDLFFVQWEDNLENYPKALYRGKFL